ncbi:hypothetical protein GGX14DRAFT_394226 [Mycena pura]|uniref:Uncharacterized protein n=1 Tax=Mycena pura TaxID=153505 RepID=A0AAD6VIX9_9AGAR|nr:hypothetical protein GGX14DRAFT_394226 [Mycena pura]
MAASTVTAGIALSASAYQASAGPLCNLLAAGAVAGYMAALYTIFFLLPLNNQLIATLRANSVKPMEPIEQQRMLDQLEIDAKASYRSWAYFMGSIDHGVARKRPYHPFLGAPETAMRN